MKKGLTEMVFILDRSGSMSGLEGDTVGGFNSLIEKQKQEPGEGLVTTILFNEGTNVLHDRAKLEEVKPLTKKQYRVCGCTALLDAVGDTIIHISDIHKYSREEDVPEFTVFVITTDGEENASKKYTTEKIKKMIGEKQDKCGWKFIFLGANIDAAETAKEYGINDDTVAEYKADEIGTCVMYGSVCECLRTLRKGETVSNREWAKELDNDTKKRTE